MPAKKIPFSAQKWLFASGLLFVILLLGLRFWAMRSLYLVGDEPNDYAIILNDLNFFKKYFANVLEPDQARLPFLISIPLVILSQNLETAVIALRHLFFIFHVLYCVISYRLIAKVSESTHAAKLYVILLLSSCYLGASSIFSVTTSDSLYLFFHIACIFYFFNT